MLAIGTYATKSYFFAWPQFIKRINAAASYKKEVHFILATDESEEAQKAFEYAKETLPLGWKVSCLTLDIQDDDKKKYKEESQFLIASLQDAVFNFAKKIRAKMFWSVEADTLVKPDALRISEWVLKMPQANGEPYYDVAACTYPNGLFLGGFGSYSRQINEDFSFAERKIPKKLKFLLETCEKNIKSYTDIINLELENQNNIEHFKKNKALLEKEQKRFARLLEKSKKYPPDGNIWEVISKHGWRRRGWMDYAYPGIGKGSIVPSDWCGFGCTLMSEKALALANFDGYQGKGTQDLFICWDKWHPAGIKIACIPHSPCDHVKINTEETEGTEENKNIKNLNFTNSIENKDDIPKFIYYKAYHEPEGELRDHLRIKIEPWIPI
jgi:hypothetical protein